MINHVTECIANSGGSSQTVATPTSALLKSLGRARIKRIGVAQFGCRGVSLI